MWSFIDSDRMKRFFLIVIIWIVSNHTQRIYNQIYKEFYKNDKGFKKYGGPYHSIVCC